MLRPTDIPDLSPSPATPTDADDADAVDDAADARPAPDQLLALQLYARGYSAEQIAGLVTQPPACVATLLAHAARALGAPDVARAVRAARRRSLIV
jgi:DNA-directed RNA polymerase specialized sigma24 family protein